MPIKTLKFFISSGGLLVISACTTVPEGPSVLVLPGGGKSFDQFRIDDAECRQYASGQTGGQTANSAGTDSGVRSAAVGTVLGAAAGAAIDGGNGVGPGAGAGLLMGGMAGAGAAQESSQALQQRYDFGYIQCMYAKGNHIPSMGYYGTAIRHSSAYIPPPPPGMPPPPPPGVVIVHPQ